jgi:hypothetical protein
MKNTIDYSLFKSSKETDFKDELLSLIKESKINGTDDYNWNDCKEWRKNSKNKEIECYNVADEFSLFLQTMARHNWNKNQSKTETQNLMAELLKTTNKRLYNEVGSMLRSNEWYNNYVMYHSEYAAKQASEAMETACNTYKEFNADVEKFKAALKKVLQSTSVKSFDKNIRIIITLIQQLKQKMGEETDFYRFIFYFYSVTRGTGKGTLVESLLMAMKKLGFICSEVEFGQLFNQFNNHHASTNFLVAIKESPSFSQLGRVEWSKYNNAIDNVEYEVERKGIQPTMAKSIATFAAATNYRLNQDNRRNLYIDMNEVEFTLLEDKDEYATKEELTQAWIDLLESCPLDMNYEDYLIKNQDFLHNGIKNSMLDFIQTPAFDKNDILKNWKSKSQNNNLSPITSKSITHYLKEMLDKGIIKVVNDIRYENTNTIRYDRSTYKITDINALFDYVGDVQEGIVRGNATKINQLIDTFFDSLLTPTPTVFIFFRH